MRRGSCAYFGGARSWSATGLVARTERESDRRRREEKWQTCWCAETSKERAGWRRLQWKYLSILGLLKRKEWPRCHRESSWQVRQSRFCQKGKEQSRLSRASDRKEGIQCQRSKENSGKRKKKRRAFLCRRTVRVKVKGKVNLTSFLKI